MIQRMNPPGLSTPTGYSHVVSARGGRTIYIAGPGGVRRQGPARWRGRPGGPDQAGVRQPGRRAQGRGRDFNDVVKTNYYLLDASQVQVIRDVRSKYFTKELPASTLVQVSRLANPDFLIEIEVIAVVAE